jgi:hypothetical protein
MKADILYVSTFSVVTLRHFYTLRQGHLLPRTEEDRQTVFSSWGNISCVCGTVNKQNHLAWGTDSPQDVTEHERDSSKASARRALT